MAGLPSLMQQPGQAPQPGQAAPPGQAPMQPGMAPQQSAQTPGGVTGGLSKLPPEQLLAMYNNPQDTTPKLAVAGAYAQAVEQQRLMQMAAGQTAMAQNAQQQQELPVVQQLMSQAQPQQPQQPPPVMAALGGLMRGYAGGGAVAFANGGDAEEERLRQQIRDMFESVASPLNILGPRAGQERQRAEDIMRMLPNLDKEQMRNILGQTQRTVNPAAYQEFGPGERMEQMAPPVSVPPGRGMAAERLRLAPSGITTFDLSSPSSINALRIAAQDVSLPDSERADLQRRISMMEQQSPSRSMQSAQPTSRPSTVGDAEMAALQQSLMNQQANIRTLSQPSDEERMARQAARQAEADRLAQEREAARAFREASTKQYEDVQQRVNRPFLDNPAAIAAFGAMLSPERGQLASGMLKGLGAIESSKQAQLDAARKEMRDDQRVAMQMESVNRQLEVARQEKLYADMQGDRQGSLAAAEKIAALQQKQSELVYGHAVKKEELRNQGMQAQAAVASANRPPESLALLQAMFPGQAPSLENLAKMRSAYSPTAGERQDTTELKILQGNLQKQVDNILLPKAQREAAAVQLERVNAKLAEMAGLVAPAAGASNDPLGIRK